MRGLELGARRMAGGNVDNRLGELVGSLGRLGVIQ
jgi:hypothetical protein